MMFTTQKFCVQVITVTNTTTLRRLPHRGVWHMAASIPHGGVYTTWRRLPHGGVWHMAASIPHGGVWHMAASDTWRRLPHGGVWHMAASTTRQCLCSLYYHRHWHASITHISSKKQRHGRANSVRFVEHSEWIIMTSNSRWRTVVNEAAVNHSLIDTWHTSQSLAIYAAMQIRLDWLTAFNTFWLTCCHV